VDHSCGKNGHEDATEESGGPLFLVTNAKLLGYSRDIRIFPIVGLFVIALACPKVVRLYRSYLRLRTVV
jgi:hypothetical protein